jgi:adenine phosphoribosyltransferase
MEKDWPAFHTVKLAGLTIELPLVESGGLRIYAFDAMGKVKWNQTAAAALAEKLGAHDFSALLTVESKAIGLTEHLARDLNFEEYIVARKARKAYMTDPVSVLLRSITTDALQTFYLGSDQCQRLKGRTVCVVDDVISTGGTMDAVFKLADLAGFTVGVVACVLTEGERRQTYNGAPVLSLDHIPLPGRG